MSVTKQGFCLGGWERNVNAIELACVIQGPVALAKSLCPAHPDRHHFVVSTVKHGH